MHVTAPAVRSPRKRFLMVARYPSIEPLGINHLVEVPGQVGWDCDLVLIKGNDFGPFERKFEEQKPDMVGVHIWAGYHLPMFKAADWVRARGAPVVMGGPYATYSHLDCAPRADWVVRGSGFTLLHKILEGSLKMGVHFDAKARGELFPIPKREILYNAYPEFGKSLIKSMLAGEGCPYKCTYCHAPESNKMHGGFESNMRSIDDVIAEALIVMKGWPETKLFYFQDDVFGFDEKVWLPEFARRWKREVGMPFHAQLRLEMTRHASGDRRLDLLVEAGCTGLTLAIESDSEFLRDHVLFRSMPDALIVDGCRKIMNRGMTLRTEQIGAVPFSDITTDLGTVGLNVRIKPTMGWQSILSPYPGVPLGLIARNFGMWTGTNDDIRESFLERSVLQHVEGGPSDIERIVKALPPHRSREPLLRMKAVKTDERTADVFYHPVPGGKDSGPAEKVGSISYLSKEENDTYCESSVRLQRFFNWLSLVPEGQKLGRRLVDLNGNEWHWERIGEETTAHLREHVPEDKLQSRVHALASEMQLASPEHLPEVIKQNPHYFTFFPAGGELAKKVADAETFSPAYSTAESINMLGTQARHHLFDYGLYRVKKGADAIAS